MSDPKTVLTPEQIAELRAQAREAKEWGLEITLVRVWKLEALLDAAERCARVDTYLDDMQDSLTKAQFEALATEIGSDAISEEQAILNIGREFLPPCAIVVLDGGEPTDEYWEFLASQTRQAQAEHDAEYASGHEWHE